MKFIMLGAYYGSALRGQLILKAANLIFTKLTRLVIDLHTSLAKFRQFAILISRYVQYHLKIEFYKSIFLTPYSQPFGIVMFQISAT